MNLKESEYDKIRPIVVVAPSYDEDCGGCIVLHLLVDRLRKMNLDAYIYPLSEVLQTSVYDGKYIQYMPNVLRLPITAKAIQHYRKIKYPLKRADFLDTPIAKQKLLKNAIVIYPETVVGNPLKAERVVRWLLHKPGFINNNGDIGAQELLFYYMEEFIGDFKHLKEDRKLTILNMREDAYFEDNNPGLGREGTCYLVRKGEKHGITAIQLASEGKLVLDGMKHSDIGNIFRKYEFLVSYDVNTLYCAFAVICGCTPIIIKPPDMPQSLFDELVNQYPGIAIGYDDVERARSTRHVLIEELAKEKARETKYLNNFLKILNDHFP